MSYETITLVNGPCHGETHSWDGGDYFQVKGKTPTTLLSNATKAFRELMVTSHTYVRDPVRRDQFIYQGEPL